MNPYRLPSLVVKASLAFMELVALEASLVITSLVIASLVVDTLVVASLVAASQEVASLVAASLVFTSLVITSQEAAFHPSQEVHPSLEVYPSFDFEVASFLVAYLVTSLVIELVLAIESQEVVLYSIVKAFELLLGLVLNFFSLLVHHLLVVQDNQKST